MVGERRRLGRRRARLRRALRLAVPFVLAAAAVALVVGAVSQIGPASGAYRRSVDRGYAALVAPVAAASNSSGASVRALLSGAPSLGRTALFDRLDEVVADTARVQRRLAAVTPPEPATAAARHCTTALDDRAAAAAALRRALQGLLGGRTGLGPVDQGAAAAGVTTAVVDMQAADVSWAACRRGVRRAPGSAVLDRSQWLHQGGLSARGVVDLVAAVAGSPSLAAAHRLTVLAVVTDPPAVATAGTLVVVPVTSFVVRAVVADLGNVDEDRVEVGGVAQLQGAPASPPSVQRTLDLAAGGSSTLTLPPFPAEPGSTYTVQVTAESPRQQGTGPIATRTVQVQVQPAGTDTVVAVPGRVVAGRPVTLTATVSSALKGVGVPAGTVAFQDDGAPLPACAAQPVRSGVATCTTIYGGASTHAIGAVYSGAPRFAGSTSAAVTLAVGGA